MMTSISRRPIVLNFDDSAGKPNHSLEVDLSAWQEKIRFGCKWDQFKQLEHYLSDQLPDSSKLGTVLMGSGDYHHLTQLLLSRLPTDQTIHLIVCDNHPDNMRYPFGIHCGSWVHWASKLENVARIDVLGISSTDISVGHAWENHWTALQKGKLHYWSVRQNAEWTRFIGAKNSWHGFENPDDLISNFLVEISALKYPVYLSIDKDVLSKDVVKTNWDQGHFLESHLHDLIHACHAKLIGADITGDVSAYHYQSFFKRFLSASDGQNEPTQAEIDVWQIHQQQLNQRLINQIDQAWVTE